MNHIGYFEIQADDPSRAMAFYADVFGWRFESAELAVKYWRISGAGLEGGLLPRPVAVPASPAGTNAFTGSVKVEDFDATAALILEHGGAVALAKFAIPMRCWQGYFLDPEGNTFGIFEVDIAAA